MKYDDDRHKAGSLPDWKIAADLRLALAEIDRLRAMESRVRDLLADSPEGYALDVRDALDGVGPDDACDRCAHIRSKHRSGWCNGDPWYNCACPRFCPA